MHLAKAAPQVRSCSVVDGDRPLTPTGSNELALLRPLRADIGCSARRRSPGCHTRRGGGVVPDVLRLAVPNGRDSRLLTHWQNDFLIFAAVIAARETISYLARRGHQQECCRCLPRRSQKLRPLPRRKSKSSIVSWGQRALLIAPGPRASSAGSMLQQRRRNQYRRPAQPSR